MGLVWALLLFSLLILIHELGHFLAAKAFGVQVNEFSLFMGPAIFSKQIGETQYSLRLIPFGGYCAMEGEDEESDNPRAFTRAAWWKRLIILAAGVTMNALLGLLMAVAFVLPQEYQSIPQIESFETWSTVNGENGLRPGDKILEVDGYRVNISEDFTFLTMVNPSQTHDLLIERNGERIKLDDFLMEKHTVTYEDGTQDAKYGFTFASEKMSFGEKLEYGWYLTVYNVRSVPLSFKMLFNGSAGMKDLSGPVGIVKVVSDVTQDSEGLLLFLMLMSLGSLISINLAIMNILPIPALDGGRIVGLLITTAIEKITGKKVDPKYEGYIHAAGLILLLGFLVIVTFSDIKKLF